MRDVVRFNVASDLLPYLCPTRLVGLATPLMDTKIMYLLLKLKVQYINTKFDIILDITGETAVNTQY